MQPGNGKYPVMFNQNKAHARDDEEDSGEEGDSEGDEKEDQAAPAAPGKQEAPVRENIDNDDPKKVAVKHMDKATRDAYYNTDELRTFS